MKLYRSLLLAVCCVCAAADGALGHTRSISYSLWDLTEDGAVVRLHISRLEWTRLGLDPLTSTEDDRMAGQILADQVRMYAGGEPCAVAEPPRRTGRSEESIAYMWRVECTVGGARAVESRLLHAVAPSHLHFARVRSGSAGAVERVLTEAAPLWRLDGQGTAHDETGRGTSIGGYVWLGIEHILTGWDHLAFVAGLMLLAFGVRDVAILVTSFTVAHSVTLALTVLGFLRPTEHVVESLIGFSIALIGVENAWLLSGRGRLVPIFAVAATFLLATPGSRLPILAVLGLALFTSCHFALLRRSHQPERLRAAVAFAFGLIHGFGFAGIMLELDIGPVRLVPALFGFNLGVEIGQLAVVAVAWPLLALLRRQAGTARWVADLGSAAVAGAGLFWLVTRSFGV